MTSRNGSRDARHTCDNIKSQIKELRALNIPWRKISLMYANIPFGSLERWVSGERDLKDEYKARLGIPYEAPAPVCLVHGVVHCYDCQSQTVTKKRKSREYKRWGWLWDMPAGELRARLENRE